MATYDPFREFDRLASGLLDPRRGPRRMPMDLYRDGDHYVLTADLPGVAERSVPTGEGVKWITREREGASFLRQLSLGQGVDTEHISATYDNGVLSVTIPVSERAKSRKIEVTTEARSSVVQAHETVPQAVAS